MAQLKDGLATDVVVAHQDISGKAEKSEMAIEDVAGDNTKKKITLKTGLCLGWRCHEPGAPSSQGRDNVRR